MDYVEDLQESNDSDPETPDTTPTSKSPSGPSGPSSGTITNFSLKTCTSALYKVSNASTLFEAAVKMATSSGDCPPELKEIAERFAGKVSFFDETNTTRI